MYRVPDSGEKLKTLCPNNYMRKFLTRQHIAKKLSVFITTICFLSSASAIDNLPDIGNSAAMMSLEKERQLGKEFMHSVRSSLDLIEDPVSNEYIQDLGERLASQTDSQEQKFTFFIVKDPEINAFAGPGGYIGVHTGLILATQSEDELASVMAHEIAHVTQRHLMRALSASTNMTLPAMAAILAAILLGQGNSQVTEAVIASTVAGTTQSQLNFSRENEQEADRVGIDMLAKSGFDPIAMANFFETLQKTHRYADGNIPEFIQTHPVTTSRIADSRGRAERYPRVHRTPEQSINYELMKTRIFYLTQKSVSHHLQLTRTQISNEHNHFAKRYQYILELDPISKYKEARQAIADLIKDDDVRVPYIVTQANIEMTNEHWSEACIMLKRGLLIYPSNEPMTLLYAKSLIRDNKANDAMQLLESEIRNSTKPPADYYRLYAEAAQKLGHTSEAFEALGEYQYRLDNLHTAIKQFQQALKENNNNEIRELKLQARIEEVKKQVLETQSAKNTTNDKDNLRF